MSKKICPYEFAFTDQEWAEMRQIAIEILESEQFGRDQFKCAIASFLVFSEVEIEPEEQVPAGQTIH